MNGSSKAAVLVSLMMVALVPACGTDPPASVTAASQTTTSGEPTVPVLDDSTVPESTGPRPAAAPAGTLAYLHDGDIYVADQDGSNAVKIVDGSGCEGTDTGEVYDAPVWSPDGRYLASRSWDCADLESDGGGAIFDAEGNAVARFPLHGWGVTWSPDSTRVAVWDIRFGTVGVYGVDGAREAQLPVPPEWSAAGDHDPKWTPDGSAVRVGTWALPLDGSAPQRLPSFWTDDACASLSPDGSLVAYRGHGSVTIARPDGSDAREAFEDLSAGHDRCHVWSPAGDRIAFATHEGDLLTVDVDTGSATRLIEMARYLEAIGFSSRGDRILFSKGGGRAGLWSVGLDGSDARRVIGGTHGGTIVEVSG